MNYTLRSTQAKISLNSSNFKGKGGEGSVFIIKNMAYKVYEDPSKMIPLGKIQELSKLSSPSIICPLDVIADSKGPVGYSMLAVPDSYTLCQLFPKAFRDRANFTAQLAVDLVQDIRKNAAFCHSHNCLIVDFNDMNVLVSKDFKKSYFIDVDSYKTPSFPPTALMESIRDRHSTDFNEGTDWFAFAILAFQLFVGIHPYKGTHTSLKTLDDRMMANMSVLNKKEVSVPPVVLPFSVIPKIYMDWFHQVLEKGKRIPPPEGLIEKIQIMVAPKIQIKKGDKFIIDLIRSFGADILDVYDGGSLVITKDHVQWNTIRRNTHSSVKVFLSNKLRPIIAWLEGEKVRLQAANTGEMIDCDIDAKSFMTCQDRLYIHMGETISEIECLENSAKILAVPRVIKNASMFATILFNGGMIENLMGSYFISRFIKSGSVEVKIPELKDYQIIQAGCKGSVVGIIASHRIKKRTDMIYLRFNDLTPHVYDMIVEEDIQIGQLNFAVLDSHKLIYMDDSENINVMMSTPGNNAKRVVKDQAIDSSCLLHSYGVQALFSKDGDLFSFSMSSN